MERRGAGELQRAQLLEIGELREIETGDRGVEVMGGPHLRAKRFDPVRELGVSAIELRPRVPHVEGTLRPTEGAVELWKPVIVHAGDIARELPGQIRSGLRQMKRAVEVAVAGDAPFLVLEEQLLHARELDARLHLIGLFGPVRHVDVAAGARGGAIGLHVDAFEMNTRPVDHELRLEVRPHGDEFLNPHHAAVELGRPVVVRQVADLDVEVGTHDAPRRLLIFEGELAAVRAQRSKRHSDGPGFFRLIVVACEARKVVTPVPFLHEHLPVGHLHRRDRDVGLARHRREPVETDVDAARGEKRPVVGANAVDGEVLDADLAGEEMNAQRTDMERTLDVLRALALRGGAHGRPEIDRDRRDDGGGQQRHGHGEGQAGVAERLVIAQPGEQFH